MQDVLLLAADDIRSLMEGLREGQSLAAGRGLLRLAVIHPTEERLERARKVLEKGRPSRGIQDIWFVPEGLLQSGGRLAFMYPGIDSQMPIDTRDVAEQFQLPPVNVQRDASLENRGTEVFFTSDLYTRVLKKLGIKPDMVLGHSIGEWAAMLACGYTGDQSIDEVVAAFQPGMLPVPGVVFVALSCGVDKARAAIQGLPDLEISHDNCPHQSIICGVEASADLAIERLRAEKVICQKLDFRSGFHTSLFKNYTGVIERSFRTLHFAEPSLPLWSATTCRPYPTDQDALQKLLIQHLVEPVRFRELTEALYADGVRVFLQVGAGSLPGFVDDTLRGRPHLALSTIVSQRSALAQLQRFCAALFAEGADFSLEFTPQTITPPPVEKSAAYVPALDLMQEMELCFDSMKEAMREVTAALHRTEPFRRRLKHTLSLKDRPELMDHCIYRQKKGWKNTSDLFPVMPMTATIDLVRRLAEEHVENRVVIAIEDISASKWLAVESVKELDIELNYDGQSRLKVDIIGHFLATAVLSPGYPPAPACSLPPLTEPEASSIPLATVYQDGWLFHGPQYQGLTAFDGVGTNGIDGKIRATPVPGALLDNVGQLAGLWIMQRLPVDRYAMPIRIKKISFFGPQPQLGIMDCRVRNRRIRSRDIMFDMEVSSQNQVWARIEAWEKWRFECDDRHWQFLLKPGSRMMAEQREGYSWFEPEHLSDGICHELSRRYLREEERKIYQGLGAKQKEWICGRVAAKDAVRHFLWTHGYPHDIYPAEIWIQNDANGKPCITEMPGEWLLHVSISHKENLGVAMVSERAFPGIDIEKIEVRQDSFMRTVFTADEWQLLPAEDRAEWITRFWSAKEAFAKSTGLGLQGDPKKFVIEEWQKDRIRIQKAWVQSTRLGSFIVSKFGGLH
ncbi:4'-phosphopantetheinyl transferase superfamily protein [Oligoflexus tunisiensis]|uniref:4'-phosphopantetheinyl transferase superfamily protein n=1 Tax=Oligoflexus tunisiensis TaxID=708132 RepID=UPI00159F110F|nr:4'-phosphopantetheinyl transferase superfamily protein [Oligoflexus tunisiensis]